MKSNKEAAALPITNPEEKVIFPTQTVLKIFFQDVEQEFIDAVKWLENKGVSGITGTLVKTVSLAGLGLGIRSLSGRNNVTPMKSCKPDICYDTASMLFQVPRFLVDSGRINGDNLRSK